MTRDYYDQTDHKCYWYFMGEHLAEEVSHAYYARSLLCWRLGRRMDWIASVPGRYRSM
jgi:hypothetical protein